MGNAALKIQIPQQHSHAKSFPEQSEPSLSQSSAPFQPLEAHQDTPAIKPFKNINQSVQQKYSTPKKQFQGYKKTSYNPPNFPRQKFFFKQFDNANSRIPA